MSGNVWVVLPLACLAGGAFALYLVARLIEPLSTLLSAIYPQASRLSAARNSILASLTALVFATALGTFMPLFAITRESGSTPKTPFLLPTWRFGVPLRADPGALVVMGVALGLAMIVAVYSGRYLALDRRYETYYPLLLLLVAGLTGMVLAVDLFSLYMFCELMSLAAYALVAFRRRTDTAIEAGFKYLIMGSVSTVVILMGISFIYRERAQLELFPLLDVPSSATSGSAVEYETGPWTRVGLACFIVGLAVKSAIVPLHTWLPDAHGRAPSSVSAMLSGIVIQSTFYVLLKVSLGLGFPAHALGTLLVVLSLFNMTLGNGLALVQANTKRLLAYSSIAQMGYIMLSVGIGLRYHVPAAIQAGFFMLLAHAAMKGLAFLCKGVCHFYCGTTDIVQLRGTARQLPLVAVALSVALGGLAAVPPLAGFAGKWLIVIQILRSADWLVYVGLAVFLLNGAVSLGYYLPVIGALFSPPVEEGLEGERIAVSPWMAVPLITLGGLVLAMGLYPAPWLDWTAGVGVYLMRLGAR